MKIIYRSSVSSNFFGNTSDFIFEINVEKERVRPGVSGRGRPKDGFGRRAVKIFSKRTEADGRRSPIVRLKDEFGRRSGKISKKRTEADAGQRRTKFVPRALV